MIANRGFVLKTRIPEHLNTTRDYMEDHSLKVLEYRKVLDKLAAHTSNSMGREAAYSLAPSTAPVIVSRRLQETSEALGLLRLGNGMPLGGIHDIREAIARAAIASNLSPRELLDVAATVGAARRLKTYLQKHREACPILSEVAVNIPILQEIESRVNECIADTAEVRDSATPELARVRSQLKVVQSRLRDRLNSILTSEKYRTFIQESIITVREGRYCIPVKSENRAQFGGLIHDASASGATVFVEPGACVEMGNELKELSIKEEQEVNRILTKLTELVGKAAESLRLTVDILADLDLSNAKALLAEEMQATEPRMNRKGVIHLFAARHPLLSGDVVPINVELGGRFTTLLITGPNTGGKTVTLKTMGLLTLMAQSGMQIPAANGSELAIFDQVFADIGDEQDIQQSLSTFSAHLKNIKRIMTTIGDNALVLMDEVGAGTDPAEGAALAKALLDALLARNARVAATTHYGELKEYAYSHAGVENASVEFDRETLRPTYHILLGVPGSSNAFYIAGRLGLPDEIVEKARGYLSSRDQSTSDLLQQIEASRKQAFELERHAQRLKQEAEAARDEYERRVREVANVQKTVRREAEDEARAVVRRASEKAENILEELRKMRRGSRKGVTARKQLTELRREVGEALHTPEPEVIDAPLPEGYEFKRGDRVKVVTWGLDGELIADPADGLVEVQMGSMRATLPLDVLRPASKPSSTAPPKRSQLSEFQLRKAIHISPELQLRAMRVDEAAPLLDKYVDDAYAAGIHEARIIHGKGTGALRKFVWEFLKDHPVVKAFRLGEEGEGGDGATVVSFKE